MHQHELSVAASSNAKISPEACQSSGGRRGRVATFSQTQQYVERRIQAKLLLHGAIAGIRLGD